jgi:hypothetical protein
VRTDLNSGRRVSFGAESRVPRCPGSPDVAFWGSCSDNLKGPRDQRFGCRLSRRAAREGLRPARALCALRRIAGPPTQQAMTPPGTRLRQRVADRNYARALPLQSRPDQSCETVGRPGAASSRAQSSAPSAPQTTARRAAMTARSPAGRYIPDDFGRGTFMDNWRDHHL